MPYTVGDSLIFSSTPIKPWKYYNTKCSGEAEAAVLEHSLLAKLTKLIALNSKKKKIEIFS